MKKLLSILLTTAILFAEDGGNYFVDNFNTEIVDEFRNPSRKLCALILIHQFQMTIVYHYQIASIHGQILFIFLIF